jgi:hypothetical protein
VYVRARSLGCGSGRSLTANLAKNTQKQLKEQGEKHAMEIAAMKRANLDTQILQQNSQLQDQYLLQKQQIDPPSATIHTFLRMLSQK